MHSDDFYLRCVAHARPCYHMRIAAVSNSQEDWQDSFPVRKPDDRRMTTWWIESGTLRDHWGISGGYNPYNQIGEFLGVPADASRERDVLNMAWIWRELCLLELMF